MRSYKGSNPDPLSHDCQTFPLGYCVFLSWKLVIIQSIYTLNLEIAHSGPGNLSGDTTVYITTHKHLIKYLDVVWGVANCNTTFKKKLPLLHSTNNFGCEISIKQNIATGSKIQEKLA